MVGWMLWGTGRSYDRAQETLAAQFDAGVRDQPVARLIGESIGLDAYVMAGVSNEALTDGPGRYPGTALPGQLGNIAIAGRRATWSGVFARLDELMLGDELVLETVDDRFVYEVVESRGSPGSPNFIAGPGTVDFLSDKGDARLTLVSLHPRFSSRQRLVVVAELVGDAAPGTPAGAPPEAELGLRSAPIDWAGIIRGGAIVALGWLAMWLIGRPRGATVLVHLMAFGIVIVGTVLTIGAVALTLPPY